MTRKKIFSLTEKDFRVETFTVGGNGGSGKDTSNTGVRIIHQESGAVGKSTDERSQLQNKKQAFERLIKSKQFQTWYKLKVSSILAGYSEVEDMIEKKVEEAMRPKNLCIEVKTDNGWKRID